jgi:ketosteroid isomerase-like protein
MSADDNKAATKAAYQAFANGDIDAASKDLADDIEWIIPGKSAISGTYHGKEEVLGFWMKLAEKGFRTEPQYFFADGDHVVALTQVSVEGHTSDDADVLTFRDGKVVKFQAATDTEMQTEVWGAK